MYFINWILQEAEAYVPSRARTNYRYYLSHFHSDDELPLLLAEEAEALFRYATDGQNEATDLRSDNYTYSLLAYDFLRFLASEAFPDGLSEEQMMHLRWRFVYSDTELAFTYDDYRVCLLHDADDEPLVLANGFAACLVGFCASRHINALLRGYIDVTLGEYCTTLILWLRNLAFKLDTLDICLDDAASFFAAYTQMRLNRHLALRKTDYSPEHFDPQHFFRRLLQEERDNAATSLLGTVCQEGQTSYVDAYTGQYMLYLETEYDLPTTSSVSSPLVGLTDEQEEYVCRLIREEAFHTTKKLSPQQPSMSNVCDVLIALEQRKCLRGTHYDYRAWLNSALGLDFTGRSQAKHFGDKFTSVSRRRDDRIAKILNKLKYHGI